MLRIIVCILIVTSCTGMGFVKASSFSRRSTELENTLELIRLMDMEITYKRDSLAKTFQKLAEMKECWFSRVLQRCSSLLEMQNTLEDSWLQALRENMENCPLNKSDLQLLSDFSLGLGKSDVRGQRGIIEPAVIRLEALAAEARVYEHKQGRMYRGLGIAGGIAIAVIII